MRHLEIEIKFFLDDTNLIRDRILALGGKNMGRYFEHNIVYDTLRGRLKKEGSLLRLRKSSATVLTFKAPAEEMDRDFKVRTEVEVEVKDFSTMNLILESIGFQRQFIYEKWRETFVIGDTQLCMDALPYGNFLEIEGQKKEIRDISQTLGMTWDDRILANYHTLFAMLRRDLFLPITDITFDQFSSITIDPAHCRRLFIG